MKRLSHFAVLGLIAAGLISLPACKEKAQQAKKSSNKKNSNDDDDDDGNSGNQTGLPTGTNTGGSDPCLQNPTGGFTGTMTGLGTGTFTSTGLGVGTFTNTGTGTGIGLQGVLGGLAGQATGLGGLGTGLGQLGGDDDDEGFDDEGFDLTGEGLGLVGTVSYEGSIRLLLTAKCLSCHSGQKDPNLSTYMAARDNASDSMALIDQDLMPKGSVAKLTALEKQQFHDWVNGGLLERDTVTGTLTSTGIGTGTNTSTGIGGTIVNDPCNTGIGTGTSIETGDNADAWTAFLNPPELAECRTQGKLYDRGTKVCHQAPVATTFQCTRDGIIAKFQTLGINATADLDRLASQGFEIDQCGEVGASDPIVMLYQKVDNGNELDLNVKRLCKNNSTLCK